MVTVNDRDDQGGSCWICGDPDDHNGWSHHAATADGLTRQVIVDLMNQGGYEWRP